MQYWKPGPVIVLLCLTLGTLIYFITRTEATIINQWFALAINAEALLAFQGLIDNSRLPSWLIYSLPDGLWMLAMAMSILMIWHYEINFPSIACTILAIIAGATHEFLQGIGMISGTFDFADLILILIAGALPVTITFLFSRKLNARTYTIQEKTS